MLGLSKLVFLLSVLSFTLFLPMGKAKASGTDTLLRKLELLQIKNQQQLIANDKLIEKFVHSDNASGVRPMNLLRNIDRRKEYLLRREFFSRILVKIDNHYRGQNQTRFLIQHLGSMAEYEAKSPKPNLVLLRFILNCKEVLVDRPKVNVDPVQLIDRFMNFTTIAKLKTSALFYEEQDYSNGAETYNANAITADQIGEQVEGKIKTYESENKQSLTEDLPFEAKKLLEPREQKMIERRLRLEKRLKDKTTDVEKVAEPLNNTRIIKPSDKSPIMNQEQFNKLFKSK